jgi:4,5-DOPA dioxygenase extradiol
MVEAASAAQGPRAPVLFVGPGAPDLARDPGPAGAALARFGDGAPRPHAALVVSAHWPAGREVGLTSALTNHALAGPSDEALPDVRWSAPGAPDVAARAAAALEGAGFRARLDPARGLDPAVWAPLRILYPAADVPVVEVALPSHPPARLVAFGAALAPLRDAGVMVVCSGGPALAGDDDTGEGLPGSGAVAAAFWEWVAGRLDASDVDGLVRWREGAPGAALADSTAGRLAPLLVALGARVPGDRVEWVYRGVEPGAGPGSFAWLQAQDRRR